MATEIDPFQDDLNVDEALSSSICPLEIDPCSSISDFEYDIADNEPEIFRALMRIEDAGFNTFTSAVKNPARLGHELSKKERLRRLQEICVDGVSVIDKRTAKVVKKKVKHLLSKEGRRFACAHGDIFDCLERWTTKGDRVNIKLRSDAALRIPQEPNRLLQGVIIAYDKHWNLIVRDVDEIYMPAVRLKKVQSSARAMPASVVYTAKQHGNHYLMHRNLECSFITGSSIVCIYLSE